MLIAAFGIAPPPAQAATCAASSGTWGTVPWNLDTQCVLHLKAGTGANTVGDTSPWANIAKKVVEVSVDGQVVLPRISAKLFSGFTALTKVTNAANLNTAGVTSMVEMFVDDSALTAIVTYMPGDTIPVAKSITLTPL